MGTNYKHIIATALPYQGAETYQDGFQQGFEEGYARAQLELDEVLANTLLRGPKVLERIRIALIDAEKKRAALREKALKELKQEVLDL